ncbi:MAG: glycosyltransferase family 92 protein [Alphaproteobacteria bacterium]|nr:glycosyltransferase family 92 protein [Alphaproteobacteria bacterium]
MLLHGVVIVGKIFLWKIKGFVMAGKIRKKIASIICVLVPFRNMRSNVRKFIEQPNVLERIGRARQAREMWRRERVLAAGGGRFANKLSVLSIVKNEGLYLREWIEYHRIVGVEKFYIYDNESDDDTRKILEPYIKSGVVEYIFWPGQAQQLLAYADWFAKHRNDTRWLAVIDLDEFIVPMKMGTIVEYLDSLPLSVAQVIISWFMFGSNGHNEKPDGLVVENYTRRANRPHYHYKSIVNPRLVRSLHVHRHDAVKRTVHLNVRDMRINHYFCKSWAEYSKRAARGCVFRGQAAGITRYDRARFDERDRNDVEDKNILRFLPELKKRLVKSQ